MSYFSIKQIYFDTLPFSMLHCYGSFISSVIYKAKQLKPVIGISLKLSLRTKKFRK